MHNKLQHDNKWMGIDHPAQWWGNGSGRCQFRTRAFEREGKACIMSPVLSADPAYANTAVCSPAWSPKPCVFDSFCDYIHCQLRLQRANCNFCAWHSTSFQQSFAMSRIYFCPIPISTCPLLTTRCANTNGSNNNVVLNSGRSAFRFAVKLSQIFATTDDFRWHHPDVRQACIF